VKLALCEKRRKRIPNPCFQEYGDGIPSGVLVGRPIKPAWPGKLKPEGTRMKQENQKRIRLNSDGSKLPDAEYKKLWEDLKIEIRLVEKIGECKHHLGDTYIYENPYKRPENVCFALLHVMDLYIWRVVLGYPSWNAENRDIYRIHCPDRTGTVWEMRRLK
jgi:uncharacterized repeat protein (TIGR04076 family)